MITAKFDIRGDDPISNRLNGMFRRSSIGLQVYLKTEVYKQYQEAQLARWKSGGSGDSSVITSEGDKWGALKPAYRKYKRRKFGSMAYGGNQILVATGALLKSVIGPGNGQNLIVSPKSITISTSVSYAPYVNAERQYSKFGPKTMGQIKSGIVGFIKNG